MFADKLKGAKKGKRGMDSSKAADYVPYKENPSNRRKKPNKKAKEKDSTLIINSTQSYLPIKDIRNGIIITESNRYIKILEFTPINFGLRSPIEQRVIIETFSSIIKTAPINFQFKTFSKKAETDKFIKSMQRDYDHESNPKCRELIEDHANHIVNTALRDGISRRFFWILEADLSDNNDFNYISNNFNNICRSIENAMRRNGNEVVEYFNDFGVKQSEDVRQLEILYELLNRKRAEKVPFSQHYPQVIKRYLDYTGRDFKNPPFIPITDYFAPKSIDFSSSKYVVVDGKYYCYTYLPSYTYHTRVYASWLGSIINVGEGFDVDIFFQKMPKERVNESLKRSIRHKRIAIKDTEDTNDDFEILSEQIDAAQYLRDGLSNNEDLYYMSTIITICGDSEDEVEYKYKELKRILISYDLDLKMCRWQMEQAFTSTLPLCTLNKELEKKTKRNVLTSTVASTYIFSSFEMCDEDGVFLGTNSNNNSLAVVDIFNTRKYKNANMAILGTSGAGKTFTMQCLALRMREKDIQVFIIPPLKGHEFKRAAQAIGGQYVNISAGSPHRINIMEIRKIDESVTRKIDGADFERSRLAEKAQQVGVFISLLDNEITNEERQLVDEAIIKTYNKKGITNDNKSLFKNGVDGEYKEMPILGDLYDTLKENPKTDKIANILNVLVHGSASSFNGQTNVDLNNKYIVLDISNLSSSLLTVGMFVVLDYVWDKVKEDRTKKKAIFLDEVWQLIGTGSNKLAAQFVLEIFKIIRGYGGAAIAATQDLGDFFALEDGKYGKGIINNSKTKIILQLEKDEALLVQDVLGLTDSEVTNIMKFERGSGLVSSNTNNVLIDFIPSSLEEKLITTDRKRLEEIASEID